MSAITQKYQMSVVSGGRPVLPRGGKSVCTLTHDGQALVVPFSNQLRVYSLDTRQCIKTVKFANSALLTGVFPEAQVADIVMGDATGAVTGPAAEKLLTLFTDMGHVIVLNYKGKLTETPAVHAIPLDSKMGERVAKVFVSGESLKVLTASANEYRLAKMSLEKGNVKLVDPIVFPGVMLTAWSGDEQVLVALCRDPASGNQKQIRVQSVHSSAIVTEIPLEKVLPVVNNNNNAPNAPNTSSKNARFVSALAIDNGGTQLALGFASGVITIVNVQDLKSRQLKWHIDAVLALAFTDDGAYLLSGGWEKVMLFWQLASNTQQFLPRLNGIVVDIKPRGKYYTLALQLAENESSADYQIVVLNAADLTSRVQISGPMPVFNDQTRSAAQPVSALKSNTQINVSKKKHRRKLVKATRQDFTTIIEQNAQTKQLYIPHLSALQTFDFYKNEQTALQFMTDGMNNAMGKVRDELNIRDPEIKNIKVTRDGNWLVSYEVEFPPDDLLSSGDLCHVLKFWSRNENDQSQWTLRTKVLNPHGKGTPITNILVAPVAVANGGVGCITSDNNGGMKYWAFDVAEKNWCLKKLLIPNFTNYSNSVSLAWSRDGSLIFHGFDDKLQIIDFDNFKQISVPTSTDDTDVTMPGEFTLDSEIQAVKLVGDKNLVIATKTSLSVIDLLLGKITRGFDLYPYVNGVYKNGHLDRLISCDEKNEKLALVVNEQLCDSDDNKTADYKAHILVFNADLSKVLDTFTHDEYISWIGWNHDTDFIFVDIQSRFGVVGTTVNTEMVDESNREEATDVLLDSANATTDVSGETSQNSSESYLEKLRELSRKKNGVTKSATATSTGEDGDDAMDIEQEIIAGNHKDDHGINMNSFSNMFENIQNVPMETLFDSVMKALS